jgi:hypothetical protein
LGSARFDASPPTTVRGESVRIDRIKGLEPYVFDCVRPKTRARHAVKVIAADQTTNAFVCFRTTLHVDRGCEGHRFEIGMRANKVKVQIIGTVDRVSSESNGSQMQQIMFLLMVCNCFVRPLSTASEHRFGPLLHRVYRHFARAKAEVPRSKCDARSWCETLEICQECGKLKKKRDTPTQIECNCSSWTGERTVRRKAETNG